MNTDWDVDMSGTGQVSGWGDDNFDIADNPARLRFAVKNLEDERAPTADRYYGYYADAHSDWGRNYYLDLRVTF